MGVLQYVVDSYQSMLSINFIRVKKTQFFKYQLLIKS